MTTPTSSIASVPVTIPSPPLSAAQGGVAPSIWLNTPTLTVGVVMAGQLDMMLVMVLVWVGIIWEHISVCTTVVSDGVHTSLTRTVVGTVAMDTTVVVWVDVTVVCRVSVTVVAMHCEGDIIDNDVIGHVQPPVYIIMIRLEGSSLITYLRCSWGIYW